MARKLASIQRVEALIPIEGADRIELAQIQGWQAIVKKGEFKVNDLGLFLEIDSVPPDSPAFSWLWLKEGETGPRPTSFRLRTKKLKGVYSQGLLMPLSAFHGGELADGTAIMKCGADPEALDVIHVTVGDDVTEVLGVTKYVPPPKRVPGEPNKFRRVSTFPQALVPKTDEERVQSCKKVLQDLAGKPWVATLKLDGTSATYVFDADENKVLSCSRNYVVEPTDGSNFYTEMYNKYGLDVLGHMFRHLAVQGEIIGPSIQGNKLGLTEREFRVFNVYDTVQRRPYTHGQLVEFCAILNLTPVEVLYEGDNFSHTLEELLKMAEGKYPGTTNEREGMVIRPRDEVMFSNAVGGWLSFKVISNRFLLKFEENDEAPEE